MLCFALVIIDAMLGPVLVPHHGTHSHQMALAGSDPDGDRLA
jgi:hypothetical protein